MSAATGAVIRGYDVISAAGIGRREHAAALGAGRVSPGEVTLADGSAVRHLPYQRIPQARHSALDELGWLEFAASRALADAGLGGEGLAACGLFVGSSGSKLPETERQWLAECSDPDFLPIDDARGHGDLADRLAGRLGLGGPRYSFGTACSSSANALLYGMRAVAQGRLGAALIVGFDFFNFLTLRGFESLMLLDPERARPFDARRQGLVLGEGVAALVLTPSGSAEIAGWRLLGGASIGDTQNPTQTSADEVARVVRRALKAVRVEPGDLAGVKAHGTATSGNDRAEGIGLVRALGGCPAPVSSLKGSLGHTLGACGAVETAALMACIDAGFWPASEGFEIPDPDCGIQPVRDAVSLQTGLFLLNFFGFGGNNCALLLECRHEA